MGWSISRATADKMGVWIRGHNFKLAVYIGVMLWRSRQPCVQLLSSKKLAGRCFGQDETPSQVMNHDRVEVTIR